MQFSISGTGTKVYIWVFSYCLSLYWSFCLFQFHALAGAGNSGIDYSKMSRAWKQKRNTSLSGPELQIYTHSLTGELCAAEMHSTTRMAVTMTKASLILQLRQTGTTVRLATCSAAFYRRSQRVGSWWTQVASSNRFSVYEEKPLKSVTAFRVRPCSVATSAAIKRLARIATAFVRALTPFRNVAEGLV